MKISFVIPAYNAGGTIGRCLDSVLAQDDPGWEIIAVDDGSHDDTYAILQNYAAKDSRITALTQPNLRPGMARNHAMTRTAGDYIAFLDADDYIEPDYVSWVKARIEADGLDVVVLDNYFEDPQGKVLRIERLSEYADLDRQTLIAVQMTGKMPWGGCRKVVKASLIHDHQIRYTQDVVGEEALFSFRVFQYAQRIGFLGKPVYHYVDYPTSQSKKGEEDPWGGVVTRLEEYLREQNLDQQYEKQLSSFALTALVVSLYRISAGNGFFTAVKKCREKIRDFKQENRAETDPVSLQTRVKLMAPLVRWNLAAAIVLISKLKYAMNRR